MGEDLSDLGEFGLIARLRERIRSGAGIVVGVGDDAAAVVLPAGRLVLATTDMLVEGIHFDFALSSPADVGYKALAASCSDIAAMGGVPRFALLSLGAPGSTPAETVDAVYEGLAEAEVAFGVHLVGGDVVRAEWVLLGVALLGEEGEAGVVRRSGARVGDVVCVTGALGGAAAGLALLRAAGADPQAHGILDRHEGLAVAHRRGRARCAEGLAAGRAGATAMIDVSDGLAADLGHVCDESGVGIEVLDAAIPLAPGVEEVAAWLGESPSALALGGGEDYELAITVPPARLEELTAALRPTPLTPIGEVVAQARTLLRADGTSVPLGAFGWDHFAER